MLNKDINCVFEGLIEKGNIFISNFQTAQQISLLKDLKINAVVTVTSTSFPKLDKNICNHLIVPIEDTPQASIEQYFSKTFQFMQNYRKKGNILVHCMAGISRSATIVIAYLMKKYGYSYDTVSSMVKRKRNKINPNPGFIVKLRNYQKEIGIKSDRSRSTDLSISNKIENNISTTLQLHKSNINKITQVKTSKTVIEDKINLDPTQNIKKNMYISVSKDQTYKLSKIRTKSTRIRSYISSAMDNYRVLTLNNQTRSQNLSNLKQQL